MRIGTATLSLAETSKEVEHVKHEFEQMRSDFEAEIDDVREELDRRFGDDGEVSSILDRHLGPKAGSIENSTTSSVRKGSSRDDSTKSSEKMASEFRTHSTQIGRAHRRTGFVKHFVGRYANFRSNSKSKKGEKRFDNERPRRATSSKILSLSS